MTAIAARPNVVELKAFSKRWWALWLWRAKHGEPVDPMVRAARSGQPWRIPAGRAVSDIGLVAVTVAEPAFYAWQIHFERQGVRLPRPSRSPVVFLPAPLPPPPIGDWGPDRD